MVSIWQNWDTEWLEPRYIFSSISWQIRDGLFTASFQTTKGTILKQNDVKKYPSSAGIRTPNLWITSLPLQRSSEICFLEFDATNVFVAVDLLTSFNRSYRGQKFFSRTVSFLSSRKKSFRQNNFDFKMKLCRIPLADNTKPLVNGSLYCWCTV